MDLYIIEYLGYAWHEDSQEYRDQWQPMDAPLFGTADGASNWLTDNTQTVYADYYGAPTWNRQNYRIVRVNVAITAREEW